MASTSAHARFADIASAAGVAPVQPSSSELKTADSGAPSPAANANAREAVEAITRVADAQAAQADRGASSATLNFNFGTEHLAVKVALQDGEVRTQFRTDSSELRDAIAAQWGSLAVPDAGTRPYHFAPPVFSSSGSSSDHPSSGGALSGNAGSFSQGHPFSREPQTTPASSRFVFGSVKQPASAPSAQSQAADPRPAISGSRRLLAFA